MVVAVLGVGSSYQGYWTSDLDEAIVMVVVEIALVMEEKQGRGSLLVEVLGR